MVPLWVLSAHYVQFGSLTSLSLSAAMSLYSAVCMSEADCNRSSVISYSLTIPDCTVSHLSGHKRLCFSSWQRHAIVLCYNMCTQAQVLSRSYWGFFSHRYSKLDSKIHHTQQSSAKVNNVLSQTSISRVHS